MRSLVALGLLGAAATVGAHPPPLKAAKGLRRRTVDLESYRLVAAADYINTTGVAGAPSIANLRAGDYVGTATALVKHVAPQAEFRLVGDHYVGTNGVAHVNFKQTAHGLDIDNADFNVNVGILRRDGGRALMPSRSERMVGFSRTATASSRAPSRPRARWGSATLRTPSRP